MNEISETTLDIWVVELDAIPITNMVLRDLSRDEKMRARSVSERRERRRYILSHHILRNILASYTPYQPSTLKLGRSSGGKPRIADISQSDLRFNLARAQGMALIGVAKEAEVGVDLVTMEPVADMDERARKAFDLMEYSQWKNMLPAEKLRAFHNGWARKQAYLKAVEDNNERSCQSFSVSLADYETPTWLPIKRKYTDRLWSLYAFQPKPGFTAAAVAEGHIHQLRIRDYQGYAEKMQG